MLRTFAPFLFLVPLLASAQTSRPVHPFYGEAGAFFPDRNNSSFGQDLGIYGALGYSFRTQGPVTLSGEVRGAFHPVVEGGSADFPGTRSEGSLTLSGFYLDARYRPGESRFFAGLAVGVVRASIENRRARTGIAAALEGGVDLTPSVYLLARYQLGQDAFKGATLGLGFRF